QNAAVAKPHPGCPSLGGSAPESVEPDASIPSGLPRAPPDACDVPPEAGERPPAAKTLPPELVGLPPEVPPLTLFPAPESKAPCRPPDAPPPSRVAFDRVSLEPQWESRSAAAGESKRLISSSGRWRVRTRIGSETGGRSRRRGTERRVGSRPLERAEERDEI